MAKKPRSPPAPPAKRPRGRPPKPGGPTPQAEIQRAYRARLAAAGKLVRLADAALIEPGVVQEMRDQLHDLVLKLERREQDVKRLTERNAYLEGELKLQERHLTVALKDNVVLKQQLEKRRQAKH